jgi:hypothetical protein
MDVVRDIESLGMSDEDNNEIVPAAEERFQQFPTGAKGRDAMLLDFVINSNAPAEEVQSQDLSLTKYSAWVPSPYPPCITLLQDLEPITIKDLSLETHHRGRHPTLRVIAAPKRMTVV